MSCREFRMQTLTMRLRTLFYYFIARRSDVDI